MEDNLDTEWIKHFEDEDRDFNSFYKEPITSIKINFLYVNTKNELEKINEEKFFLTKENMINKNELIKLIKTHDKNDGIKYRLLSILNYNIDVESEHIYNYLKYPEEFPFLHSLKQLEPINLNPSISILQDLNSIYFIFHEINPSKSNTKRIILRESNRKTKHKRV